VFEKIRIKATPGHMKEPTVSWAVISHFQKKKRELWLYIITKYLISR
jgi:hypothetical protein